MAEDLLIERASSGAFELEHRKPDGAPGAKQWADLAPTLKERQRENVRFCFKFIERSLGRAL